MAAEIAGKALQKNWKVLHDQLNLDGLVPSLFQDELIDFNLKKDLEEFSNRQRRTDKFLNHLLENITEENFKTFVNLLRDDNNRKHQELGCRLKETFEKMIQNGGSGESGKDPKDDAEMCEDHPSTISVIQRTSHRYSFRKRSSGRFSKAFVDEQSESSSSENDEESEDDFIVPDSLTSTDYDYRNSQESDEELLQEEGDDDSLNSESVEETPEVDYTMDSEIDKENNGQGSPKTRSVVENEYPRRKRRSSSSATERQPLQELNSTRPKRRAISSDCHSNSWIGDVEPRPFPYIPQLGDKVRFIVNAYEEYTKKLQDEYDHTLSESYQRWKGREILCQLVDVQCKNVKMQGTTMTFYLLDFICKEPIGEVYREHTVRIRYCNLSGAADFLVLAEHYDSAVRKTWEPSNSFLTYLDNEWIDGEVVRPYPMKHGQHYKVLVEGKSEHLAPWEMFRQKTWPLAKYDLNLESLLQAINLIWDRNEVSKFQNDVDHPEYPDRIAIPMCLSRIRSRIINKYYRSLLSVLFDIRLIYLNAFEFNDDGKPKGQRIIQNAHKVVHSLYHVAQSTTDNTEYEEASGSAVELLHKVDEVLSKESFEERYPLRVQPPRVPVTKTRRRVRTRFEESDDEY